MQNKEICMASAWQCSNLLQFDDYAGAATESAILFQPRLPFASEKVAFRGQGFEDGGLAPTRHINYRESF